MTKRTDKRQGAGADPSLDEPAARQNAKPIDLPRVRRALAALDLLAEAAPHLRGPPGPDNRAGWIETLEALDDGEGTETAETKGDPQP